MSVFRKICFNLLNFTLKFWIKSKVIPSNPILELKLDLSEPILYIAPDNSKIDLLTLRIQCLLYHLPDPLNPLEVDGKVLPRYFFIHNSSILFHSDLLKIRFKKQFSEYLDLYRSNPYINIQILPVSVMFGRASFQKNKNTSFLGLGNHAKKILSLIWFGRDTFIQFSNKISLFYIISKYSKDKNIEQKLARAACIHFTRQRLATVGPRLIVRKNQFKKLMSFQTIKKAIEYEAFSKKTPINIVQKHAISLIEEISANVSYEAIRLSDRILSWTWNRLYQGIKVTNAQRVRQLAQNGNKIVYIPCHRSHMDYLLISYVLYHEGLAPPHIAAGINLNFWPAGSIFRRLGAFFIRRTFNRNKLYSTIFREYLGELFTHGYSIEYFIEGSRSRTGRLLEPKTGTLSMTIQTMLRGNIGPIVLIPIYVGYEYVIEVETYIKELHGALKKKEGILQMLYSLCKLRNFGYSYINFGTPLPLIDYMNQRVPQWYEFLDPIEVQRPNWLTSTVKDLAEKIMIRINNSAAVNAINLCSTALLAAQQYSLTREQLLKQISCYLKLMRNVPYSNDVTIPNQTPDELLDHALSVHDFSVRKDEKYDIILLSPKQVEMMIYYRNNIYHLLVIPSIIATIIIHHRIILYTDLLRQIKLIYPMLKAELFLHYEKENLDKVLQSLIKEMIDQNLIFSAYDEYLIINPVLINSLRLLAAGVCETLQKYFITISILYNNTKITRYELEKESYIMAQNLSNLNGSNIFHFVDKSSFSTLVMTLREEGYIHNISNTQRKHALEIYTMLSDLMTIEIKRNIKSINIYVKNNT